MKTAIVTGITGQDGSYLAELLLKKKYNVLGIYRRTSQPNFHRLATCIGNKKFTLIEGDLTDEGCLYRLLNDYDVDEFYNGGAVAVLKPHLINPAQRGTSQLGVF
jgi:GDPmannose 4,6-dehydratase